MGHRRLRLADAFSLSRIPLALIFVGCFSTAPGWRLDLSLFIVLLAQFTDHADGYLARRLGSASEVGWLIDSVADRVFYIACLLAFERIYGISLIIVWLFIIREIALYAVRIATGELKHYRAGAAVHATLVRLAILFGCLVPYGVLGGFADLHATRIIDWLVGAAALAAYVHLGLMLKWGPKAAE